MISVPTKGKSRATGTVGCAWSETPRGFVFVRERGAQPVDGAELVKAERTDNGPTVLVRPDGYIAWAGDSSDKPAWAGALARWTGHAEVQQARRA